MAVRGRHSADDALAAELAAGKTVRAAATAAGVAERTAFRRLTDATFKARVSELRSGMIATAAGRLADGMASAADVLRALMTHDDPHVRHKAAVKVLELAANLPGSRWSSKTAWPSWKPASPSCPRSADDAPRRPTGEAELAQLATHAPRRNVDFCRHFPTRLPTPRLTSPAPLSPTNLARSPSAAVASARERRES